MYRTLGFSIYIPAIAYTKFWSVTDINVHEQLVQDSYMQSAHHARTHTKYY